MTSGNVSDESNNDPSREPALFAARLTPHRVMLEIIARQALRMDGADGAPKKAVREAP